VELRDSQLKFTAAACFSFCLPVRLSIHNIAEKVMKGSNDVLQSSLVWGKNEVPVDHNLITSNPYLRLCLNFLGLKRFKRVVIIFLLFAMV